MMKRYAVATASLAFSLSLSLSLSLSRSLLFFLLYDNLRKEMIEKVQMQKNARAFMTVKKNFEE